MNYLYLALPVLALILVLVIIRLWLNKLESKSLSPEVMEWMKDLSRRIDQSSQSVDQKLTESIGQFNSRLDSASRVMGTVQKSIGEFSEIGRSMQELQQFLSAPKLRGNIGEHILNELLTQYLPHSMFSLQYGFKSGEKVDAIVHLSQGLLSIDAKFPSENFRKWVSAQEEPLKNNLQKEFVQDVKKHIKAISQKYIKTDEGTVDYALMYIPSESVYYEIINNTELYDYATGSRVLPVSPLSFYAFIQAILMSYQGMKIQQQAKEVIIILNSLKKDYEKTDEAISLLTKHVTNAYNQTHQVNKSISVIGQKLDSISSLSSPAQEKLIE